MASRETWVSPPRQRLAWQPVYESALRETDHKTLFKRVEVAEAELLTRREALKCTRNGLAERTEIDLALAKLRLLKKEILGYS